MKRVANEHIQTSVTQYLKRRHIGQESENIQKRDLKFKQNVTELTLSGMLQTEGSSSNLFSYSSISGDVTACDQQYTRLKNFVLSAILPYKTELLDLLFPVFVQIFLELIINGQKTPAHKFYSRHHSLFDSHKDKHKLMDCLKQIYNKDDVITNPGIHAFRDNKYRIAISSGTMEYLQKYLKAEDCVVLMQVLNQHLQIKDSEKCNIDMPADRSEAVSPPQSPGSKSPSKSGEVSMASLKRCIQRVNDGPPCLHSICFYTFINTYQGLSSCTISEDRNYLCGGFEDSSIKIWNLTSNSLATKTSQFSVSKIKLAKDVVDDSFEEKREVHETGCIRCHSGTVYSVKFTPKNEYILSCSDDTTVRLSDMETLTNKVCYRGHNYPVWDIDVNELGCHFASASADHSARLWSTDRIYPIRSFIGHTMDVDIVRFHPNGNYVATGSTDKTVRLWTIQDGRSVRLFQGHKAAIYSLAFSPDGSLLASAGEDRRIKLWDIGSGKLVKEFKGHSNIVHSLSFSKEKLLLASGGMDSTIKIWDVHKHTRNQSNGSVQPDSDTSPELLGSYPTKSTNVLHLRYSKCNVLIGAGAIHA